MTRLVDYNIDLFSFKLDRIYRINRMTVALSDRSGQLREDDPVPTEVGFIRSVK
jgi:hypothetical protein